MDAAKRLLRLTEVELLKFRRKFVTWGTWILLFVFPMGIELFLALWVSRDEAVYPRVTHTLFAGEVMLVVALTTIVISVMALGNDYELGTVRVILSQGVDRYQYVLSKVLATVVAAFANGLAYVSGALLATVVTHLVLSDVPLAAAAGPGLVWRALGSVGVTGLIGFCFAGVVILALVVGRSSWVGMLGGLGIFMIDFYVGGLRVADGEAYRCTVTYHFISLLDRCFESDLGLRAHVGPADPGRSLAVLALYGGGLTLAAILVFHRQDLMAKA
jgi:ABC-type transport system involved in multi-copper enzyme maturation permease subunit